MQTTKAVCCIALIYSNIQVIRNLNNKLGAWLQQIYCKSKKLAADVDSEVAMPRIVRGRQTMPNSDVASASDYWWVTVTIPFIDSILSEFENRFSSDKRAHFELFALIRTRGLQDENQFKWNSWLCQKRRMSCPQWLCQKRRMSCSVWLVITCLTVPYYAWLYSLHACLVTAQV